MRASLGELVLYMERDSLAAVQHVPEATIQLPLDTAGVDAAVPIPWGCALTLLQPVSAVGLAGTAAQPGASFTSPSRPLALAPSAGWTASTRRPCRSTARLRLERWTAAACTSTSSTPACAREGGEGERGCSPQHANLRPRPCSLSPRPLCHPPHRSTHEEFEGRVGESVAFPPGSVLDVHVGG